MNHNQGLISNYNTYLGNWVTDSFYELLVGGQYIINYSSPMQAFIINLPYLDLITKVQFAI